MQTQRYGSTLKCALRLFLSSVVAVSSLTGCLDNQSGVVDGEPTANVESALDRPLNPVLPGACVTPPVFDQTVVQDNLGDVAGGATADSPDNSYFSTKGSYVVEVTETTNPFASSQMALAYSLQSDQSQAICQNTTTSAFFYGFDDSLGCWVRVGPSLKHGVWHPSQDPFIPSVCDDAVRWHFPTTISKVRISGGSLLKTNSGSIGQRIEEGTSWVH
jgi:hypothetical protein